MSKENEDFEIVDKTTVAEINEELQFVSAKLLPKVEELTAEAKGLIAELRNVKKEKLTKSPNTQATADRHKIFKEEVSKMVNEVKEDFKKEFSDYTEAQVSFASAKFESSIMITANKYRDVEENVEKLSKLVTEAYQKVEAGTPPKGDTNYKQDIDALDGKIDSISKTTKKYEEKFEKTLDLVEELAKAPAKAPAAESTDEKTLASILQKLEKLDNIDKDAATIKHNANILVDRTGTGFKSFGLFVAGAIAMFVFFAASGKISINFN